MSQANHALNTTERAAPTRRALLCTAPLALAAALPEIPLLGPLVSTGSQCSPEFREWYALAKTTPEVMKELTAWEEANPGADIDLAPDTGFYDALERLEDKILTRPRPSQSDIDEMAIIALYWSDTRAREGEDPNEVSEFALGRDPGLVTGDRCERSHAHVIQVVAARAMQRLGLGGAHV